MPLNSQSIRSFYFEKGDGLYKDYIKLGTMTPDSFKEPKIEIKLIWKSLEDCD